MMGWGTAHRHQFVADGLSLGDPADGVSGVVDEQDIEVGQLLREPGATIRWDYDLRCGWEHDLKAETIEVSATGMRYPMCVNGSRACPPANCGGATDFNKLLTALDNPGQPEGDDLIYWLPDGYDPTVFDIANVNLDLLFLNIRSEVPLESWPSDEDLPTSQAKAQPNTVDDSDWEGQVEERQIANQTAPPITIVMADDDEDDVMFAMQAMGESRVLSDFRSVSDGAGLLDYLRGEGEFADVAAPGPQLILMDLNMPKMSGLEALTEIKKDPSLKTIPVVILTTSKAGEDIARSYDLGAASYIQESVTFDGTVAAITSLGKYWFEIVALPVATPNQPERLQPALRQR